MPIYTFRCSTCEKTFDKGLSRENRTEPQVCACGGEAQQTVSDVGFVMKGDGWVGKNMKIKEQMAAKNARLTQKGREKLRDAPGMTLVPNVAGERVDSWQEAKRLAASLGKDTSSYDAKIEVEKK